MSSPLISVVLPVYNRAGWVARAIESVLAQTYRNFELIVVDDGSTDGTRGEIERFAPHIRFFAEPHRGVYAARNTALRHARGELIAFIDSDDIWLPERLESQVPLMVGRPEVGLVFGDTLHVTPSKRGPMTGYRVSPPHRGRVAAALTRCNFIPTLTVLVRRTCLEEIGGFVESARLSADYLAWFRIALRHEIDYVDRVIAEYMVHAEGISSQMGKAVAARIQLFADELENTRDEAARALIRRTLVHLSVTLAGAAVRGRAAGVPHPLRLALTTAWRNAGFDAAPWAVSFAFAKVRTRLRRVP